MILLWMNPAHLSEAVREAFEIQDCGVWESDYGDAFDEPILNLTPKEGVDVRWMGAWYGSDVDKPTYHVWAVTMPDQSERWFVTTRQEGQNDWFDLRGKEYADFLCSTPKKAIAVNRRGFMVVEADDSTPPRFRLYRLKLSEIVSTV